MLFPAISDTIIAVSSGWHASPLGIVRLSGPDARRLVISAGLQPPPEEATAGGRAAMTTGTITAGDLEFSGAAYWFTAPRSYTGQDLVELHVPGCLPLLRELCACLIERGARRALPGEFTARAYLSGKLTAEQVEDVLATISADRDSEQRRQRREHRAALQKRHARMREELADLLALVEAGIDFVEEEGIRFLSAEELRNALDRLQERMTEFASATPAPSRLARPHVAIIGLPNAGKSTLFNALLGYERAIVSPVLGTTRDVLSAEVTVDGIQIVLQDCAGLGRSVDDLALAAHLAAERNTAQADVVIWVQAWDAPWDDDAAKVLEGVELQRKILVLSKCDLGGAGLPQAQVPTGFARLFAVSAVTGEGLPALRREIADSLSGVWVSPPVTDSRYSAAISAIARARSLCAEHGGAAQPELISLELRSANDDLAGTTTGELVDSLLGRLFSEFCIGK